jgi:hypothetical protein
VGAFLDDGINGRLVGLEAKQFPSLFDSTRLAKAPAGAYNS